MRKVAAVCLLVSGLLGAQVRTRRTTSANPTAATGAYNDPAATMHGVLKKITGKELMISTGQDQTVVITRTRKTKFLRDGKEIKPSEIPVGSALSIDVGLFPDLTPQAVNVRVDAPPVNSPEPGASPVVAPEPGAAKPSGSPNR